MHTGFPLLSCTQVQEVSDVKHELAALTQTPDVCSCSGFKDQVFEDQVSLCGIKLLELVLEISNHCTSHLALLYVSFRLNMTSAQSQ